MKMFYWIDDLTCWLYLAVIVMCLWDVMLCVEYRVVRKARLSAFFYYVVFLLLSIAVSDIFEFISRLSSTILWVHNHHAIDDPFRNLYNMLTSFKWAVRMMPKTLMVGLITLDFTLRKYWNKRLFEKTYPTHLSRRMDD